MALTAERDPENCKSCPDWNDRAGRCRLPPRARTCGSDGWRYESRPAPRLAFDLFALETDHAA